jgi:DNA-binding XRE family transcriptional regulator
MGYLLRMHSEIRAWLVHLRGAEPELARLVGEAVLAMLDAGESLGPPLVVPLESVLRPPDDPREVLDFSYQRQLEALQKVRRGVADVATSRKRVELQVSQLEQSVAKLAGQREVALADGREDLASEARTREAGVQERLSEMRRQLLTLTGEEERLTAASQHLAAKVDTFRVQKETIKASYTAAEASRTVRAALADIDADVSDPEVTATELTDPDDIQLPPGMMELRPGAPDDVRVALLFVVDPPDTAVLVAWLEDPGASPEEYQEAIRIAAARLPAVSPGALISHDAESFLDEFFPGEETEVEIGAAALVARHRAHTLAEARQRMRLTQAQVAARMNVRQERVSAIERAEPGATEVRTLAAYVRALGGRLEISADIGGERITLR